MTNAAVIRGPAGNWHSLRVNPDYKADWRAHGGAREVVETAGFVLRTQTEADLEAARWGLLAWEDPRERSKFSPFWIDDKMLQGVVVEATKSAPPVTTLMRAAGMHASGLRLLDGALVLKWKRWRRVEQVRLVEGDPFDPERTGTAFQYDVDGNLGEVLLRLQNLHAMTSPGKRHAASR